MNYGGNMPDWHQYNTSQTNEIVSAAQNVNSGHLTFIPGVSPSSYNAIGLNTEGLDKHQNGSNFNPRHYQSLNNVSSGPTIPNNNPLTSMMQMQNCIGHYGSQTARNPMLDNLNPSMDPRNTGIGGINDDLAYRTNQVPYNGPIAHLNGPNCNVNGPPGSGSVPVPVSAPVPVPVPGSVPGPGSGSGQGSVVGAVIGPGHGVTPGSGPGPGSGLTHDPGAASMGPRNANVGSMPPGRPGPPSFISCKGLCCNPDPNTNYQQWEKFGSYQANTSYRDNMRPSGYQTENRRYGNHFNFRKEGFENKESLGHMMPNATNTDHRRNFVDYKYHKDHVTSRSYPASSGMLHNYPVQNYNCAGEYQKYQYPMKEHPKVNNMNVSNPGSMKHQEQNFIAQQKYNNKQIQYQNGSVLHKGMPSMNVNANVVSPPQNSYYSTQFPRNLPAEMSHECQETNDANPSANRMSSTMMHNTHSRYQVYQQKIAMQRFSMENHLKELSRIPGYQSHPKYKECIFKYREILKLQQPIGYQNQMQQAPRVTTPMNAAVPPINLQFDQNGMLINPNYLPETFPRVQNIPSTEQRSENVEKQSIDQIIHVSERERPQVPQPQQLIGSTQNEHMPPARSENLEKQNQFPTQKDFNQNQLKVQSSEVRNFESVSGDANSETMTQQKVSKEFANKPDLDVRQFLANWDETDDEDGSGSNLPDAVLSSSTPVVVVSYENLDLSSKPPQNAGISKENESCSGEASYGNESKDKSNVVIPKDCVTVAYPTTESTEHSKASEHAEKDEVVTAGSIIHCISNGPDEIPTIHIVDNLEISNILEASGDQIVEGLENPKTIPYFQENANIVAETSPQSSYEKNGTPNLSTQGSPSVNNTNEESHAESPSTSEELHRTSITDSTQELQALSASPKSNLDSAQNLSLKKQNSFTSEESHNPDDISLPDLPTSECTPISTTLNTPIQSDSEESSGHIEDLTISTNPIEIMQNSPVISFTQSPVKIEPYGQLNTDDGVKGTSLSTLELQFQDENRYKNDAHEQSVTLNDFQFSPGNAEIESTRVAESNIKVKDLESGSAKRKAFVFDTKSNEMNCGGVCSTVTSAEYNLEMASKKVQDKTTEENCNSEISGRPNCPCAVQVTKSETVQTSVMVDSVEQTSRRSNTLMNTSSNVQQAVNTILTCSTSTTFSGTTRSEDEAQFPLSVMNLSKLPKCQREICVMASKKEEAIAQTEQQCSNIPTCTTNTTTSTGYELDSNNANRRKEHEGCAHFDKSTNETIVTKIQKSDSEHERRINDPCCKVNDKHNLNSQTGENCPCHMTSHSRNCPVSVIKDKVVCSKDTKITSEESTEAVAAHQKRHFCHICCERPSEYDQTFNNGNKNQFKTDNAEESTKNTECKKALQRTDVSYTKGEDMHRLKAYRKRKNKSVDSHDVESKHRNEAVKPKHGNEQKGASSEVSDKKVARQNESSETEVLQHHQKEESTSRYKACLEQNVLPTVTVHSDVLDACDDPKRHVLSKNFISKNISPDFGIQVTNVNLKIKDNDLRKELTDTKKERRTDSLDGFKIEINVSCTERNSRCHELDKRFLCDKFRQVDDRCMNHTSDLSSCSAGTSSPGIVECQCHLYTKESKATDNSIFSDKNHKIPEHLPVTVESALKEPHVTKIDAVVPENTEDNTTYKTNKSDLPSVDDNVSTKAALKETVIINLKEKVGDEFFSPVGTSSIEKKLLKMNVHDDVNNSIHNIDTINPALTKSKNETTPAAENACQNDKNVSHNVALAVRAKETDSQKPLDDSSHVQSVLSNAQCTNDKEASASGALRSDQKSGESNLVNLYPKALNPTNLLSFNVDKLKYDDGLTLGFEHALISTNETLKSSDSYIGKWKKPKVDHSFKSFDIYESTSGYINPIFSSIDVLEDLHTVPVYTTKDGKISYSPNRKFTYHKLMMETRKREECSTTRRPYYTDATLDNYYDCSKFYNLHKRKRYVDFGEKRRHTELKDMKFFHDRRKHLDALNGRSGSNQKDRSESVKSHDSCLERCDSGVDRKYDDNDVDHEKHRAFSTANHEKLKDSNKSECTINDKSVKSNAIVESEQPKCSTSYNKDTYIDQEDHKFSNTLISHTQEDNPQSSPLKCGNEDLKSHTICSCPNKSMVSCKDCDNVSKRSNSHEGGPVRNESANDAVNENQNATEIAEVQSVNDIPSVIAPLESPKLTDRPECKLDLPCTAKKEVTDDPCISKESKQIDLKKEQGQIFGTYGSFAEETRKPESTQENNRLGEIVSTKPESELGKSDHAIETDNNCFVPNFQKTISTFDDETKTLPVNSKNDDTDLTRSRRNSFERDEIILNEAQTSFETCEKIVDQSEEQEDTENLSQTLDCSLSTSKTSKIDENSTGMKNITENCSMAKKDELDSHTSDANQTISQKCEAILNSENVITKPDEATSDYDRARSDFTENEISNVNNISAPLSENKSEESVNKTPPPIEERTSVKHSPLKEYLDSNYHDLSVQDCFSINEEEDIPNLDTYYNIENEEQIMEKNGSKTVENKPEESDMEINKPPCLSSFETYRKTTYLSTYNTDMKSVPKIVIKKSEIVNSKVECSLDYLESCTTTDRYDARLISGMHPKIPKMIITKTRSRSATPSIEISDRECTDRKETPLDSNERDMDSDSEDSEPPKLSLNSYESKIIDKDYSKNLKLCVKRKDTQKSVPKVKIRRIKSESVTAEDYDAPPHLTLMKFETQEHNSEVGNKSIDSNNGNKNTIDDTEKSDKIRKLKLRRQDTDKPLSPDRLKRRQDTSATKFPVKKTKNDENETKKSPSQSASEKVPKVIIKRSQAGAEFKCEISKAEKSSLIKDENWQPKVKLQRLRLLDRLVKDSKHLKFNLTQSSLKTIGKILTKVSRQKDHDDRPKLCRSSSTSNLSPVKQKQRRLSDFDCIEKLDSREVADNAYDTKVLFDDFAKANTSSHRKINRDTDKNLRSDLEELADVEEPIGCAASRLTDGRSEGRCSDFKRKHRTESFLQTSTFRETDNEMQHYVSYNDPIVKAKSKSVSTKELNSSIVSVEKNDKVIVKTEYESSDDNESEFMIEDKHSKSDVVSQSQSFDNIDTSVITVDSSDESQTTIEILPASPDDSQSDMQVRGNSFRTIKNKPLFLEDAIPTQLELELEVIDNNNSSAFMAKINEFSSAGPNFVRAEKYEHISKSYDKSQSTDFKHPSNHYSKEDKFTFSKDKHLQRDHGCNKSNTTTNMRESTNKEAKESSRSRTNCSEDSKQKASVVDKYFYCNDLLVKEVLAAKEALKKCLGQSEIEIAVKNKSRPKTAAEKKQGSGFELKSLKKPNYKSNAKNCDYNDKPKAEKGHKVIEKHSKVDKREARRSVDESTTSTCTYASTEDLVTISLKASKQLARITTNGTTISPTTHVASPDGSNNSSVCGAKKVRRDTKLEREGAKLKSTENSSSNVQKKNSGSSVKETKTKEDNMPVLEPEVTLNFDSTSDRDSSRSPPVITNQDVVSSIDDAKNVESKLITPINNAEDNKNTYKDCEMGIADIVTQLAYHEKATIKHRRYCNLCERWFPTTSRHRRHLAGYQHRHTELMQRKSIHTLFILFTGKPCPKLLPANTVRNDCSIGELTPLQIAVQDVAKCAEHVKTNLKTKD